VRIVIALGGNALLHRGERPDAEPQRRNVLQAAEALAPLAGMHELIVTHGNGPQVGVLAMESAADPMLSRPFPLDPLGAETQGLIGYWLMQSLHNVLPDREVVALLTQCVVDGADPAFATPTKFVGPVYDDEVAANALAAQRKWVVARDGNAWRRVVPSPEPREVVEEGVIRRLVDSGVLVVCAGGGGVPVVRHADGTLEGVEAVIDKDLTAALLAERLGADALLLLTDVVAVEIELRAGGLVAHRARPCSGAARVRIRRRLDGPEGRSRVSLRRTHGRHRSHRLAHRCRRCARRNQRHASDSLSRPQLPESEK
jgi:carbamate kinase